MKRRMIARFLVMCVLFTCVFCWKSQTLNAKDYTSLGCVSWVKDRALAKLGITLPATGTNGFGLLGASAYWTNLPDSYARGSEPRANSLAIWTYNNGNDDKGGQCGHVAFVESVNGDTITVTEGGCPDYSYAGNTGVICRNTTKSGIKTLGGCSGFLGYVYLSGTGISSGNDVYKVNNLSDMCVISGNAYSITGTVYSGGTNPTLHLYVDYEWVSDTWNNEYGNYAFYLDTTKYSDGRHLIGIKMTNEDGYDNTLWYTVFTNNSGRYSNDFAVESITNNCTIDGNSYAIKGVVIQGGTNPALHLYVDYEWVSDTWNNEYGNYAFYFDTTKYSDGRHLIGVKMTNEDGYDNTLWYTVFINNSGLYTDNFMVSTLSQGCGIAGSSYAIKGVVRDGGIYPHLHLYVDGEWIQDTDNNEYGNYAFYLDTTKYEDGEHLIEVKLTNDEGNSYTKSFSVNICNQLEPNSTEPVPTATVAPTATPTPIIPVVPTVEPTEIPIETEEPVIDVTPTPEIEDEITKPGVAKIEILKSKKEKVAIKWKKVIGAKGYQIQYATNKKFKSKKTKMVKETNVTIKKLKKKRTYYFRVRAYKLDGTKKVYGKWSAVKKVKVKK